VVTGSSFGVDQLALVRNFYVSCILVFSYMYVQQQNT